VPTEQGYEKTILCLANSRRPRGRCIAGKEFLNGKPGKWIRPVNKQNDDAISEEDMQYEKGGYADVLDIVSIQMAEPAPYKHQTENHAINPKHYWEKKATATWAQIVSATDSVKGSLWSNGNNSYHGKNDKIAEASSPTNSLLLIKPARLDLIVGKESEYTGGSKRKVRAKFQFNGEEYNFVVTDPWVEDKYFAGDDGTYKISEARICISLAKEIRGYAIKLAVTVITQDRVEEES
jgi:hypothetical protein